jgi:hypothetical protein
MRPAILDMLLLTERGDVVAKESNNCIARHGEETDPALWQAVPFQNSASGRHSIPCKRRKQASNGLRTYSLVNAVRSGRVVGRININKDMQRGTVAADPVTKWGKGKNSDSCLGRNSSTRGYYSQQYSGRMYGLQTHARTGTAGLAFCALNRRSHFSRSAHDTALDLEIMQLKSHLSPRK